MSVGIILAPLLLMVLGLLQMAKTQGASRNMMNYQHTINRSVFYNDSVLLSIEEMFPGLDKELKYDSSVPIKDQIFQHKTRFVKVNETYDMKKLQNCYGIERLNAYSFFSCCFEPSVQGRFQIQVVQVVFEVTGNVEIQPVDLKGYLGKNEQVIDMAWNEQANSLYLLIELNSTDTMKPKIQARDLRLLAVNWNDQVSKISALDFKICTEQSGDFLLNYDLAIKHIPQSPGSINPDKTIVMLSEYGTPEAFRTLLVSHSYNSTDTLELTLVHELYSPNHDDAEVAEHYATCFEGPKNFTTKQVDIPANCSLKEMVPTQWTLILVCVYKIPNTSSSVLSLLPCLIDAAGNLTCPLSGRSNVSTFTDKIRSEEKNYEPQSVSGAFLPIDPRDQPDPGYQGTETELIMMTQEGISSLSLLLTEATHVEVYVRKFRNFTQEKRYTFSKPVTLHKDSKGNIVSVVESRSGFKFTMVTNFPRNTTRVYKEKFYGDTLGFFYDPVNHTPFMVAFSTPATESEVFSFSSPLFYRDNEQEVFTATFDRLEGDKSKPVRVAGKLVSDDLQSVLSYEFTIYPSFNHVSKSSLQAFENWNIYHTQLETALLSGNGIDLPFEQTKLNGNGFKFSGKAVVSRDNSTVLEIADETITTQRIDEVIRGLNATKQVLVFESYILCLATPNLYVIEPRFSPKPGVSMYINDSTILQANDRVHDFVVFRLHPNSKTNNTLLLTMVWNSTETTEDTETRQTTIVEVTKAGVFHIENNNLRTIHSATWRQKVLKADIVTIGLLINVIGIVETEIQTDDPNIVLKYPYIFQFGASMMNPEVNPFPEQLNPQNELEKDRGFAVDFYRNSLYGYLLVRRSLGNPYTNNDTIESYTLYQQKLDFGVNEDLTFMQVHQIMNSIEEFELVRIVEEAIVFKDLKRGQIVLKTVNIDSQIGPWVQTSVIPTPPIEKLLQSHVYGKVLYLTFEPNLMIIYDISSQSTVDVLRRVIAEFKTSFDLVDYLPSGQRDKSSFIESFYFADISVNSLDNSVTSTGLHVCIMKRRPSENGDGRSFIHASDHFLMSTHRPKLVLRASRNVSLASNPQKLPIFRDSINFGLKIHIPSFMCKSPQDEKGMSLPIEVNLTDFNSRLVAKVYSHKPKPDMTSVDIEEGNPVAFNLMDLIGSKSQFLRFRVEQPKDTHVFSVTQSLRLLPEDHSVYRTLTSVPLDDRDTVNICNNFTVTIKQDRVEITDRQPHILETAANLTTVIPFSEPYDYTIQKYPSESVPYWAILTCRRLNFAQTKVELLIISRTNLSAYSRCSLVLNMTIQQTASLGVVNKGNSRQILIVIGQNTTSSLLTMLQFATIKTELKHPSRGISGGVNITDVELKALQKELPYELVNTKFFYLDGELIMVSPVKYSSKVIGLFVEIDSQLKISAKDPLITQLDSISNTGSSNMSVFVDEKNLEIKIFSIHEANRENLTVHSVKFSLDREGEDRFYSVLEHSLPWPKGYPQLQKFRHTDEMLLVRTAKANGDIFYFVFNLADRRIISSLTHEDIPGCTPAVFNTAKLFILRAQRMVYVFLPNSTSNYVMQMDSPKLYMHRSKRFSPSYINDYKLVMEGLGSGNQITFPIHSMLELPQSLVWLQWSILVVSGILVLCCVMACVLFNYQRKANQRKKKERISSKKPVSKGSAEPPSPIIVQSKGKGGGYSSLELPDKKARSTNSVPEEDDSPSLLDSAPKSYSLVVLTPDTPSLDR